MKYFLSPRFRWSLLLVLLLAGGACKEILSLIRFQVSDSSTFTIPAVGLVGTQLPLPGVPVTSTSVATYKANNTQAQYVQNVTLDQLQLTIIDPAGQNFDALKNVKIDIATDANGSNRVPLAALASIPPGPNQHSAHPRPRHQAGHLPPEWLVHALRHRRAGPASAAKNHPARRRPLQRVGQQLEGPESSADSASPLGRASSIIAPTAQRADSQSPRYSSRKYCGGTASTSHTPLPAR